MQEIKQRIGYIIIIVAALVVITVTWIRFDEPSFDVPQGDVVSEDNIDTTPDTELPDFAYVEQRGDERVLVNERDGYEVVLEENWLPVYNTNVLKILTDTDVPSGELTSSFVILRGDALTYNLREEVDFWLDVNQETCNGCYKFVEDLKIDNKSIMLYQDSGALGESLFYYLVEGKNLFIIHTKNYGDEQSRELIKQIIFKN